MNLGFALGSTGGSFSAIDFATSFSYDESYDENHNGIPNEVGLEGYALDTGDPANPMIIDFGSTFIQVQLAGYIEITGIARIDGIFYLGIDLDAAAQEFRLLAVGEMTIGPDIGSADPILSIGAIGVLILNSHGAAGDFTVNLGINLDILEVDVYARVIFNSSGSRHDVAPARQAVRLPHRSRDSDARRGRQPGRVGERPARPSRRVSRRPGHRAPVLHDQGRCSEPRVGHRPRSWTRSTGCSVTAARRTRTQPGRTWWRSSTAT